MKKICTALLYLVSLGACDTGFQPVQLSVRESRSRFVLSSATTDLVSFDITVGVVGGSARVCMAYTAGSETQRTGSRSVGKVLLVSQGMSDTRHPLLPDDSGDEYAKTICWDNISTGKYTVQIESGSLDDITAAFKTEPVSIQPQALWARVGSFESTALVAGDPLPVVGAYPYVRAADHERECLQLQSYSPYGGQSIPSRFILELATAQKNPSTNVLLGRMENSWHAHGDMDSVSVLPYRNFVEAIHGAVVSVEKMLGNSPAAATMPGVVTGTTEAGDLSLVLVLGKPLCLGTGFNTLALGTRRWCMRNDLHQLTWTDPRTGVAYKLNAGDSDNPIIGHELCTYK